jgi:hypothetical protein
LARVRPPRAPIQRRYSAKMFGFFFRGRSL